MEVGPREVLGGEQSHEGAGRLDMLSCLTNSQETGGVRLGQGVELADGARKQGTLWASVRRSLAFWHGLPAPRVRSPETKVAEGGGEAGGTKGAFSPGDDFCGRLGPEPLGGRWGTVETVPQALHSMSGPWRQNKTLQGKKKKASPSR